MLCPRCGAETGDKLRLCERCLELQRKEQRLDASRTTAIHKIPTIQPVQSRPSFFIVFAESVYNNIFILFVVLLYLILVVSIGYYIVRPQPGYFIALLSSAFAVGVIVSVVGYFMILIEMFVFSLVYAVISLSLFPPLIYFFAFGHWEQTKRGFYLNIFGAIVAISAYTGLIFKGQLSNDFSENIRYIFFLLPTPTISF